MENAVGRDNIIVYSTKLTSVDMQNEFGEVQCRMRPLSFDEARKYNDFLVNKELPDWYWTLTPWSTEERGWNYSVAVVSPSGGFNNAAATAASGCAHSVSFHLNSLNQGKNNGNNGFASHIKS